MAVRSYNIYSNLELGHLELGYDVALGQLPDASIKIASADIIPAMLQTKDYASALERDMSRYNPSYAAFQQRRQTDLERIANEASRGALIVIGEAALRNPVGDAEVMAEQLEQLQYVNAASRVDGNMSIRVLSPQKGLRGPQGALEIIHGHSPVAFQEGDFAYTRATKDDARHALEAFDRFWDNGLGHEETTARISQAISSLAVDKFVDGPRYM